MKEFPPFRLDTVNRCLWRRTESGDDERLLLTPTSFAILRYLVDHAGRPVTQIELFNAVWPNIHVGREVLRHHLFNIRRALGDDAKNPAFLETVPGGGYRFIAPVSEERMKEFPRSGLTVAGRTYVLPQRPQLFVGRQEALLELKRRLGIVSPPGRPTLAGQAVTVVCGWPGVGKSTFVAALAHDAATQSGFPDGVLWTSLGEGANLLSALTAWGLALGAGEIPKLPTLTEATAQLAELLINKRMLLIVDDVWQVKHAVPFEQIRGSHCALVLTTRKSQVAEAIAPTLNAIYSLPVLTEDSAVELLRHLAPSVVEGYPQESRDLVRDLEYLPLAVHVAGRMLNAESNKGWGVRDLIVELRSGAKGLSEKAPVGREDLATPATPTVAAMLRESTDRLDEPTREYFAILGVFAPKPATFDLAALQAIWRIEDPKPTVRELVNHGLLEAVGGRFQLHGLLIAHARSLLED